MQVYSHDISKMLQIYATEFTKLPNLNPRYSFRLYGIVVTIFKVESFIKAHTNAKWCILMAQSKDDWYWSQFSDEEWEQDDKHPKVS